MALENVGFRAYGFFESFKMWVPVFFLSLARSGGPWWVWLGKKPSASRRSVRVDGWHLVQTLKASPRHPRVP